MNRKYNIVLALAIFLCPLVSFSQSVEDLPVDEQQNLNIDKNVKLIGPPVNLPKDKYIVPEVSEREKYTIKQKPVKKTTAKNKEKNNKKVIKITKPQKKPNKKR